MSNAEKSSSRRTRIPYWVPSEARNRDVADTFNPKRSFRYRPGDSYHPEFLADVKALDDPIVAEGDSWFSFPNPIYFWEFYDLLEVLEDRGRIIVSKATHGDLLDNMVYGGLNDNGSSRAPGIDEAIRALRASRSKVFLISGGGNDLVGEPLRVLLNHKKSGRELLRMKFAEYVINDYLKAAYITAANRVWNEVDREIKIITHGYANALPTGRPTFQAFGPWLKPSFAQEGISFDEGKAIVRQLIDMFNAMLEKLSVDEPRFMHVDFRKNGVGNYPSHWDDEMHLDTDPLEMAGDMLNEKIKKALGE